MALNICYYQNVILKRIFLRFADPKTHGVTHKHIDSGRILFHVCIALIINRPA